jgi:hypothetical protein
VSTGPFVGLKPEYTLTHQPSPYQKDENGNTVYDDWDEPIKLETPPSPITFKAHLKELSSRERERLGFDAAEKVIEILCSDPKEGDSRARDKMAFSHSPDFDGMTGILTIQARPKSRLTPVVDAIGVKYYARFEEG